MPHRPCRCSTRWLSSERVNYNHDFTPTLAPVNEWCIVVGSMQHQLDLTSATLAFWEYDKCNRKACTQDRTTKENQNWIPLVSAGNHSKKRIELHLDNNGPRVIVRLAFINSDENGWDCPWRKAAGSIVYLKRKIERSLHMHATSLCLTSPS